MPKYYAGIGSRKTPYEICQLMTQIATHLASKGWMLRSGGADGADKAFQAGAADKCIILRPHHATAAAMEMASEHHPAWERCKPYVRKLHGRNSQIILGPHLDSPVEFVLCWTPDGALSGGTALGIRIAKHNNINVLNLANHDELENAKEFLT